MIKLVHIFAILLAPAAFASDDDEFVPVCPSLQEIDSQIMSCGDNFWAAEKAQECAEKIKASWKVAAASLQTVLVTSGKNQSHAESVAGDDYSKAMAVLKAQIEYMQDGTELLASYPRVMINFPDSQGEDDSLSCFNEAFATVQATVTELDDEIVKAMEVYELAKQRKTASLDREKSLGVSLESVPSAARAVAAARVPAGRSENGQSDVTGLKQEKELPGGGNTQRISKSGSKRNETQDLSSSALFSDPLDERALARGDVVGEVAARRGQNAVVWGSDGLPSPGGSIGGSDGGSVGTVLWKDNGERAGSGKDLAVPASAVTGVADLAPAYGSLSSEPSEPVSGNESFASASASMSLSAFSDSAKAGDLNQVAAADADLFSLVRSRYRETDLFRGR